MSLVNEALKRAKEVQDQKPPAAPNLQFRPIESARPVRYAWVYIVTAVIATLSFLVILLTLKLGLRHEPGQNVVAQARAGQSQTALPLPSNALPPPAVPPSISNAPSLVVAAPEVIAPLPDRPPAKPTPPPLRLQAIFYNPTRPSAVISGHTVRIGDTLSDMRVLTITRQSVDLITADHTNHLVLPD